MSSPKVPPHDLNAERSVLGAVLVDADAIIKVADKIAASDLYDPQHQLIYSAMLELFEQRQPIDVVTVTSQLRKHKQLKQVGAGQVAELASAVNDGAHAEYYAQLVKNMSVRRSLINLAANVSEMAFDDTKEARDVLDQTEQQLYSLSQTESSAAFVPLRQSLVESFDRIEELQKNGEALRGLPTGFHDLDEVLAGFQKSNLIILAARPGVGKTAFALNITHFASVMAKKKVGFFSLEMSKEELVDRLLVSQADIDAWRLKTGRLDQQDLLKISDAMGVLAEAQFFIDDTPGLSIFEMRTRARKLMLEHKVDMLVVDYLQLAHGRTTDNRVQEVGEVSQGLKNIARELKIPVLALAQLSRAIESRGERTPQLSDLRESGSIEQDADVVMFLYRKDDDIRESVSLKLAKHRNGALGEIDLYFKGDRIKFYGMEHTRTTGN
jgi:replicative DNA helicase